MKDKVNVLLAPRGQGIKQIQHISSEYIIKAHNSYDLLLDSYGAAT
jgi:hypothetical protein